MIATAMFLISHPIYHSHIKNIRMQQETSISMQFTMCLMQDFTNPGRRVTMMPRIIVETHHIFQNNVWFMSDTVFLKSMLHSECSIELLISGGEQSENQNQCSPSFMWCKDWFLGCLGWTDQSPWIKLFIYLSHFSQNMPIMYEGWNFNSGNYLFTTDTK